MELIFCCVKEKNDLMLNIIKQEIDIEEALKKKLEFVCSNTNCEIKKGLPEEQLPNYMYWKELKQKIFI